MPPRNYANPKSMTATTARTPRPRPGLKAEGEVWIWLTGGTLALCVAMIVGLLALLAWQGLRNFWPKPLLMVPSKSGELVLGKLQGEERSKGGSPLPIGKESGAAIATESDLSRGRRLYLRTGNFEWTNRHFTYVSDVDSNLNDAWQPIDAWALERRKMGRLFAFPTRMFWHAPRFPDEMAEQIAQCLEAVKTIDEILTIFFAGSQTSANVTQNLILHLCKHPHYKQKLMRELEELDSELTFYTYCFNEAMRIQPPVFYSSTVRMSQDVVAGGLHIRKHDGIFIGMGALCNDPDEW